MSKESFQELYYILHRAIQENNEFAVEALIRAGADVDIQNIDGKHKYKKCL